MWIDTTKDGIINTDLIRKIKIVSEYVSGNHKDGNIVYTYILMGYYNDASVQIGSFSSEDEAKERLTKLKEML